MKDEAQPEWRELATSWLVGLKVSRSPGTVDLYSFIVKERFFPWLRELGWTASLSGLTSEHLNHYMAALGEQGLAGATQRTYRAALASFFGWLRAEGEIANNPFEGKRVAKPLVEPKLTPLLTVDGVATMLKLAGKDRYLGPRNTAIISVLFDAGLRVSELCGLDVYDVDLEQGLLTVRHAKGNKPRYASFGKTTGRDLDVYMRWRRKYLASRVSRWAEDTDALFIGRDGSRLGQQGVYQMTLMLGEMAGVGRVHPHRLRHASASALARAGADEMTLRRQYGWSPNSGMATHYTREVQDERAQEMQKRLSPMDAVRRA